MNNSRKTQGLLAALLLLTAAVAWWLFHPRPKPTFNAIQVATRIHLANYKHEWLALYHPPDEIFTPEGRAQLEMIQKNYTPYFLPYLVNGATLIQPQVLYNPWFDLFIYLAEKDELIHSVVLLSSLSAGQTPVLDLPQGFWTAWHERYENIHLKNLEACQPFRDLTAPLQEFKNLTNHYGWPSRLYVTAQQVGFDLYIQRPDQGIYATAVEPGTYLVLNQYQGRLFTNVLVLPPYSMRRDAQP